MQTCTERCVGPCAVFQLWLFAAYALWHFMNINENENRNCTSLVRLDNSKDSDSDVSSWSATLQVSCTREVLERGHHLQLEACCQMHA